MDTTTALLEQLRDVQQPPPPEGVPLWLIAANVLALSLIVALLVYRRQYNANNWRKQLIKDLRMATQQPAHEALASAATILRQLMLFRGHSAQSISGEPWLHKLDTAFNTQWFTKGAGRAFGDALYQNNTTDNVPIESLFSELEVLIKTLPSAHNHKDKSP